MCWGKLEGMIEERARGEEGVADLIGKDGFLRTCFLGDCMDIGGGDCG